MQPDFDPEAKVYELSAMLAGTAHKIFEIKAEMMALV